MRICIPVTSDQGVHSALSGHFGSAPLFMLVDTATGACRALVNDKRIHQPGDCGLPVPALEAERLDALIVANIGMGGLDAMSKTRVPVFLTECRTVEEAVRAFEERTLRCLTSQSTPGSA